MFDFMKMGEMLPKLEEWAKTLAEKFQHLIDSHGALEKRIESLESKIENLLREIK